MAGGSENLVYDLVDLPKLIFTPFYGISIAKYYPGPGFLAYCP